MNVYAGADALVDALGPDVELADDPGDASVVIIDNELIPRLDDVLADLRPGTLVQSLSAGVEWLLPRVPDGLRVASASGVHDIPVSEWCVAAILALERKLFGFWELQRRGEWDRDVNDYTARGISPLRPIEDLAGKRVLIVGLGSIGQALQARLEPFGVEVTGVRRTQPPLPSDLPRLLPDAHVVVLLLPLTPESERMVDAAFIERMKPGALLVNAARGRHVDTDALVAALHAGRIRAALDVTEPEPLPPGHALWSAPNVMITPHVAGSTERWRARAYRFAGDQARRVARGEQPLNVVGVP